MNKNGFFVTFVNLVSHVISITANRSEAFEDWKIELQKSIDESADFEKSIEALRYTVINVEKFEGKMEHIFELCQEVLDLGDPDEYVTVIDIRQSLTCKISFSVNMLDIVSCLRRYVAEKQIKDHYTKNLDLTVHSVQNKNLLYFDMLLQSTQNIRSIHEFMQKTFVECMLKEIEIGFNECYNDLVYDVIVKTSLKILLNCRTTELTPVVREQKYQEIETKVLQELKGGKYESILIKQMLDDFYRILETEFGNSLAKIIAEKTLEYQDKTNIKHFDTESVLEEVKKLYSNKLSILFHKKLSIMIRKRADELKIIHLSYFEKVYRSFIEDTCNFFASQSGVVLNKSANDIVRNFNEHKQQSMVYLNSLAYDTNNVCGNETDPSESIQKCYDAENAQDLQCRGKNIKILCNVEITHETIPLLIHILNNSNDTIETDADQIIYINVKKALDKKEISNKIIDFAINSKRKKVLSNDGEFDVVKFSLSTKSADKILRCDIDEQLFMGVLINLKFFDNSNLRLSIHEKIWKENYYIDVTGNIKISFECTEYVKYIDQKLSCFTHDLQCKNTLTVCIQSALYDCKINMSAISGSNGIERVKLLANGEDDTDETWSPAKRKRTSIDQNENNTKDCQPMSKILPPMSAYLKNIQLLSEASEIPGFAYTYIVDGVYAEEHSVMVTSQTPSETDELIATKIEEINENIKQFCNDSALYKLTSLEIKLSDVLKNNGNPKEWNNATKEILKSTKISLECYEKIISTYAIDSNSFNATNNHDTFSVNTDSYCIHMHVFACDNAQSLVCLVRKEMEFDLRILPFTFLLNVYADILQDLESKNVNNSQDIKHPTANTVTCIFKTMLDLNFSMLGDVIAQHEERKIKFTEHLSLLYEKKFLHEMPEESEIRLILQYVKKQRDVVKASRCIRITTISIDETDTHNLSINKELFRKMKSMQ